VQKGQFSFKDSELKLEYRNMKELVKDYNESIYLPDEAFKDEEEDPDPFYPNH
jgi:hypothetical protein